MTTYKKTLFFSILAGVLLMGAGCVNGGYGASGALPPQTTKAEPSASATLPPPPLSVAVSGTVDKMGNPTNPSMIFSRKDKRIFLVVHVQNPQRNDLVSIVRYFNGKYLKANTIRIASPKVQNAVFKFSKPNGYPKGTYDVKVFYNKKGVTAVRYSVK